MAREVAIIGDGRVGSTIAYTLFLRGSADRITLIDSSPTKAEGDALDMIHAQALIGSAQVRSGTYADLSSADVIVLTASIPSRNLKSRNELLRGNAELIRELAPQLIPHLNDRAVFVVVSNPLDVIATLLCDTLHIDRRRIVGTGTLLETARARVAVATRKGCSARQVSGMVIGEHGDAGLPLIGDIRIEGQQVGFDETLDAATLTSAAVNGGYEVQARKGYTNFGVAGAACVLIEAILNGADELLPICCYLPEYDCCLSVPAKVGRSGVEAYSIPELTGQNLAAWERAVKAVTTNVAIARGVAE